MGMLGLDSDFFSSKSGDTSNPKSGTSADRPINSKHPSDHDSLGSKSCQCSIRILSKPLTYCLSLLSSVVAHLMSSQNATYNQACLQDRIQIRRLHTAAASDEVCISITQNKDSHMTGQCTALEDWRIHSILKILGQSRQAKHHT